MNVHIRRAEPGDYEAIYKIFSISQGGVGHATSALSVRRTVAQTAGRAR